MTELYTVQACQDQCRFGYEGLCTFFIYNPRWAQCKLYKQYNLMDYAKGCRRFGYAKEPEYGLCSSVFDMSSDNGCYVSLKPPSCREWHQIYEIFKISALFPTQNFREDTCMYHMNVIENLHDVVSTAKCQLQCKIHKCAFFTFYEIHKFCVLFQQTPRFCDDIHGTPFPSFSECIEKGKIPWWAKRHQGNFV